MGSLSMNTQFSLPDFLFLALLPVMTFAERDCGLPAVPAHATIQFNSFPVKARTVATYACDPGYILLGKEKRSCTVNGTWTGFTPLCVVDVALGKPAKSSSQQGRIGPAIAVSEENPVGIDVDGNSEAVCYSSKAEVAPWWTVNLLDSYVVHSVRLVVGQSCCDDGPVYIEVRVGNDRDISRNALCGRYNGIIETGAVLDVRCYRPLRGIFVSVHQLREVPNTLSLCKVQAFSDQTIAALQCPVTEEKVDMGDVFTYGDQCYHFFNSKADTWDNAQMYCSRRGGSLVWGTSPAFQAFVSWAMAHRYNQFSAENPNYWMGATRADWTDGQWMWVKGNTTVNPVRAFWSSRDPPGDFVAGTQNCVMFDANSGWLWRQASCERHLNWVCEFTPRSCGNPAVQANSSVQYSSSDVGSVAVYGCTGGLYLRGTSLRRCQPNGKWSDQPPVCTMDGCGVPTTVENGEVTYNSTSVGAVAQYSCLPKYKPLGQTTTTCKDDGLWDTDPPQCILVDCGPPPSIPHGTVTLLDRLTSEGSRLEYSCETGYGLIGSSQLTCASNEVWQGAIPFCQEGGVSAVAATFLPPSQSTSSFNAEDAVTSRRTRTRTTSEPTTSEPTTLTTTTEAPTTTTTTTEEPTTELLTEPTTEPTTNLTTTSSTSMTTTPSTTVYITTVTSPTTSTTTSTTTTTTTPTTTPSTTATTPTTTTSTTTTTTTTTTPSTTPTTTSTTTTQSTTVSSTATPILLLGLQPNGTLTNGSLSGNASDQIGFLLVPTSRNNNGSMDSGNANVILASSNTTGLNGNGNGSSVMNGNTPIATLNGVTFSNLTDGNGLLDGLGNVIFTPAPVITSSRQPTVRGRFQANNAMLLSNDLFGNGRGGTVPSTITSTTTSSETSTTTEEVTSNRPGVGSPFDHTLSTLETSDGEQSLDETGKFRTIPTERSNVVSVTEVVVPTMVQAAHKGVGGWIALGVILGLLLLLLLLILVICVRRRRQRRSGVELTSSTTVTQYSDNDNGAAAAFNNRYRKAWDNLQLESDAANTAALTAGKDTPVSQTTFKSTGPRRRDENPMSTQSEMIMSPSHAGTLKSVGGLSEAYHGSEEILVDDSTIPQMHEHNLTVLNTGNGPETHLDIVEVPSQQRPQAM